MNATTLANKAYTSQAAPVRTARGAEYEAFVKITRNLQAAAKVSDSLTPQLAEAVELNRKLWSLLANDAAGEANKLPEATRAGIISLYEFTRTQSSKVLRGEAKVQVLIEINAAIMRGLQGGGSK